MKRKILSVLGVLMAVLMSTAALSACAKAPAGDNSSGGSGESVSTEQGGEPSVSESAGESVGSSEPDLSTDGAQDSGELKYGFTPCSYEETTEFIETEEAEKQIELFAKYLPQMMFSATNDWDDDEKIYALLNHMDELEYILGNEYIDSNDDCLIVPRSTAEYILFKYYEIEDYNPENALLIYESEEFHLPLTRELSAWIIDFITIDSVYDNEVTCKFCFHFGIYDDVPGPYQTAYMKLSAQKDDSGIFLRLISRYGLSEEYNNYSDVDNP